jgi:glycosyltransferase involved in cell wall biosynthesis
MMLGSRRPDIMPVSTDPIVSVVVPFRDPIPWMLQEAVDGVFGQTYSAWELLLVNDGGDGSPRRLLRRIVGRDPARIRLLQHPGAENRGAAASRNLGIREGSGRYVPSSMPTTSGCPRSWRSRCR